MSIVLNKIKERKFKYICFFWTLISIQFIIGYNLQEKGYSINSVSELLTSIAKIIGLSILFIIAHYFIVFLIRKIKSIIKLKVKDEENRKIKIKASKCITKFKVNERKEEKVKKCIVKHKSVVYFAIIIICHLPTLLAFFPIIPSYDGPYQIKDMLENDLIARQPLIHTVLLTAFYLLGTKINSVNIGMFLFTIFQMTIMATIFTYSVKFIEEKTNKKWIRNISIIFYALFPYNQLFPLMTTKDTLYAGFMLLFIIQLYKIFEEKDYKVSRIIFTIVVAIFMFLFRNNAIYAIAVAIPFIILILVKEKEKLSKLAVILAISIMIYIICSQILMIVTKAKRDTSQEKLSIFSQAIGKICKENSEELTTYEKEKIALYFKDYKEMGKYYVQYISDNTKARANCKEIDSNPVEFIKFMMHLFKRFPRQCIDSFLNNIRGYWYIKDSSFNKYDHYKYPYQKGCLELSFDDNSTEYLGLEDKSVLPELQHFYRSMFCHNDYQEIPVLRAIFQPAIYFYAVIAFLLYAIYKRNKNNITIGIFMFAYFITCILGPIALIRYIYGIIVAIPIIIGIPLSELNKDSR